MVKGGKMGKISYGNVIRLLHNTRREKRKETLDLILELLKVMNTKEAKLISDALIEEMPGFMDEEELFGNIEKRLWTKNDVATYLNKSPRTVQRMISNGDLKPVNKGQRPLLFRYEDVKEILLLEEKTERLSFINEKYSETLNFKENEFENRNKEQYIFASPLQKIPIDNITENYEWIKAA